MKRLLTLGVILISTFSIGSEDECCKLKHVGDHMYLYTGLDDTTSEHACLSQCVYSKSGEPDSKYCFKDGNQKSACKDDDVKLYHQFYSGLSSLHGHLKSLLTPEQGEMVLQPKGCSNCPKPKYCWHGQCVGEDEKDYPIGDTSEYMNSISEIQKLLSFFFNESPCSEVRIECYGVCLETLVNALASCIEGHLSLGDLKNCLEGILNAVSDCKPCFCQLVKAYWPGWWWLIRGILGCPEDKQKEKSYHCDRDCALESTPLQCVFNFKLEMLKTDQNGRRADGRLRSVLAYNQQIPGPSIVICEGDELVVHFKNDISGNMTNMDGSTDVTTLHFHGIREKNQPWSDGVPFVTQCPISSGDEFTYGFQTVDGDGAPPGTYSPPGTYWYHSHVGSQRTNGAYGALIIKEKVKDERIDVDNATNTLVLQEWYESSTKQIPRSILINGKSRINGEAKYKAMNGKDESEVISNYLKGKGGQFQVEKNENYNKPDTFTTNYAEFDVQLNQRYRFRVIGAISQNFPLRLSIDGHKFTAIAVDSLDIKPVPELTDLWLAAGERYDIVVQTKISKEQESAYKIKVFGYAHPNDKKHPLCTIAWLKYPGQIIDYSYVTPSDCNGFNIPPPLKTLNPVPNNYKAWQDRIKATELQKPGITGDIFIADLRATEQQPTINIFSGSGHSSLLNTHYIEFTGNITFNGLRMTYPDVPFLLQDPAEETDRCGSECDFTVGFKPGKDPVTHSKCTKKTSSDCPAGEPCKCQHVIKEPWVPGYWAEFVLINNNLFETAAHPIHQHGGWYWVVGEGKSDQDISRTIIMEQDKNCTAKKNCLPRNFDNPPAKDTIQVPQNGYVIVRTKLDNAGTWIFHCHINYHVTIGMAMVIQIGALGEPKAKAQEWCTGPLMRNEACKTPPPPPGGGTTTINWFYGMEPNTTRCVAPGKTVTFLWVFGHTVDQRSKDMYEKCDLRGGNHEPTYGDYVWKAPNVKNGHFYFACGLGYNKTSYIGGHCKNGNMNAHIHVSDSCKTSPSPPPSPDQKAIDWFYDMPRNTARCVKPGMTVTFNWPNGHNVNQISEEAYGTGNERKCDLEGGNHDQGSGPFVWPGNSTVGDYYFACGLDYNKTSHIGGHCKKGNMNAHIRVSHSCKTSPSPPPSPDHKAIDWFYDMPRNTTRCVKPGMTVTFNWPNGHNVNQISEEAYGTGNERKCDLEGGNHDPSSGPFVWPGNSTVGDYYFACGLEYNKETKIGGHCKNGNMNAHIIVSHSC